MTSNTDEISILLGLAVFFLLESDYFFQKSNILQGPNIDSTVEIENIYIIFSKFCFSLDLELKRLCPLSVSPAAIFPRYPQPFPHVQSVWVHLDSSERALPEPLPPWAIGPDVPHVTRHSHHPTTLSLQSGAGGHVRTEPVLQLQPFWPAHEPGHMELFVQPQFQLPAFQRLWLLWRCLR